MKKNRFATGYILITLFVINVAIVNSQLDFGGTNPIESLKKLLEKAKAKLPGKEALDNKKFGGGPGPGPQGHFGQDHLKQGHLGQGHHGHAQIVPQSKFSLNF